jgi:hypothetical protein
MDGMPDNVSAVNAHHNKPVAFKAIFNKIYCANMPRRGSKAASKKMS